MRGERRHKNTLKIKRRIKILECRRWSPWIDPEWKPRVEHLFYSRNSHRVRWSSYGPNSLGHLRKNMPIMHYRGKGRRGQPRTHTPFYDGPPYCKYRQRAMMREILGEIVAGKLEYDAILTQKGKRYRRPFTL